MLYYPLTLYYPNTDNETKYSKYKLKQLLSAFSLQLCILIRIKISEFYHIVCIRGDDEDDYSEMLQCSIISKQ